MMEVKKYRAATTRAALEQIKQELGEDAFVLETKRVKSRSLFGLKSHQQIEISAAAPSYAAKSQPEVSKLNLTDDTSATPNSLANTKKSADQFEKINALLNFSAKHEGIELSPDAPKVVHPKRETAKSLSANQKNSSTVAAGTSSTSTVSTGEKSAATISNREFELLRAELREVKFSLGAFTARKKIQPLQTDAEAERFLQVFDAPFYEAYIDLTETGISGNLARRMIADIIPHFEAGFVKADQIPQVALQNFLATSVKFESDSLTQTDSKAMAFIGATGVGKTTTIAKLAARFALHENRRVELVTLDTYRIAAVDQLRTYAEIIGAGCHVVRTVLDLDVLLRRLPPEATVLIDTAGRSPHDLADQYELSEYLRLNQNIRKCLAIQATTHCFDAAAVMKKFQMYGADCLVLTKLDETSYPGALIETISESSLPMIYLCNGQRVPEDLQTATAENLVSRLLGDKKIIAGH